MSDILYDFLAELDSPVGYFWVGVLAMWLAMWRRPR